VGFKTKMGGGAIGLIGFMLSPLSWWNDLFVNVPLALAFAWVVSLFVSRAFSASFVVGYWLTNIIGLVMLQKGAKQAVTGEVLPYTRKQFLKDLIISLAYTGLIVALVKLKFLQPLPDYFPKRP